MSDHIMLWFLKWLFVQAPVFALSAYVGEKIVSEIPILSHDVEVRGLDGPNFAGFLLVICLFVYPATLACCRIYRVSRVPDCDAPTLSAR